MATPRYDPSPGWHQGLPRDLRTSSGYEDFHQANMVNLMNRRSTPPPFGDTLHERPGPKKNMIWPVVAGIAAIGLLGGLIVLAVSLSNKSTEPTPQALSSSSAVEVEELTTTISRPRTSVSSILQTSLKTKTVSSVAVSTNVPPNEETTTISVTWTPHPTITTQVTSTALETATKTEITSEEPSPETSTFTSVETTTLSPTLNTEEPTTTRIKTRYRTRTTTHIFTETITEQTSTTVHSSTTIKATTTIRPDSSSDTARTAPRVASVAQTQTTTSTSKASSAAPKPLECPQKSYKSSNAKCPVSDTQWIIAEKFCLWVPKCDSAPYTDVEDQDCNCFCREIGWPANTNICIKERNRNTRVDQCCKHCKCQAEDGKDGSVIERRMLLPDPPVLIADISPHAFTTQSADLDTRTQSMRTVHSIWFTRTRPKSSTVLPSIPTKHFDKRAEVWRTKTRTKTETTSLTTSTTTSATSTSTWTHTRTSLLSITVSPTSKPSPQPANPVNDDANWSSTATLAPKEKSTPEPSPSPSPSSHDTQCPANLNTKYLSPAQCILFSRDGPDDATTDPSKCGDFCKIVHEHACDFCYRGMTSGRWDEWHGENGPELGGHKRECCERCGCAKCDNKVGEDGLVGKVREVLLGEKQCP